MKKSHKIRKSNSHPLLVPVIVAAAVVGSAILLQSLNASSGQVAGAQTSFGGLSATSQSRKSGFWQLVESKFKYSFSSFFGKKKETIVPKPGFPMGAGQGENPSSESTNTGNFNSMSGARPIPSTLSGMKNEIESDDVESKNENDAEFAGIESQESGL